MDRKWETYVPVEERHEVSLSFHDIGPCGNHLGKSCRPVVFLSIADKYKPVVYFIEFWGDKETSCQKNRDGFWIQLGWAVFVQKVSVHQLNSDMDSFCALLKSEAKRVNSLHYVISLIDIGFCDFSRILWELEAFVIVIQLIRKHIVQNEHRGLIRIKYLIFVF